MDLATKINPQRLANLSNNACPSKVPSAFILVYYSEIEHHRMVKAIGLLKLLCSVNKVSTSVSNN